MKKLNATFIKGNEGLKCLWCLQTNETVSFKNRAHTIPKSLGGQDYNRNVCDECNTFFGSKNEYKYSIEEALKEAFNISRQRLISDNPKRNVGRFKSRYFDIKIRKGKKRLYTKPDFKLDVVFQKELCHAFKRGLYKMYLEELNRQKGFGYEEKYNPIRDFARYNIGSPPVLYFRRTIGAFITLKREGETPVLIFDRMDYLYSNETFQEIEFLGHVFGFPKTHINLSEFDSYIIKSVNAKGEFFKSPITLEKMTDMDIAMTIMND